MLINVSGDSNPRPAVITNEPGTPGGGAANAEAYIDLPRKYRPLTNANISPKGAPCSRRRTARSNSARGLVTIRPRTPDIFAGESRKTRSKSYCNSASAIVGRLQLDHIRIAAG